MSTRSCVGVVKNGEFKVAQYCQFDGYPTGVGEGVMNFLKNIDIQKFSEKINNLPSWLSDKRKEEINKEINDKNKTLNRAKYDYLLCDSDVLNYIYNDGWFIETRYNEKTGEPYEFKKGGFEIEGLLNDEKFFGDSLFCEWAYVIDLDKNVFEIYKGFNKRKLTEKDRFYYLQNNEPVAFDNEYKPVKIVGCYSLDKLPETLDEKTLKKSLKENIG